MARKNKIRLIIFTNGSLIIFLYLILFTEYSIIGEYSELYLFIFIIFVYWKSKKFVYKEFSFENKLPNRIKRFIKAILIVFAIVVLWFFSFDYGKPLLHVDLHNVSKVKSPNGLKAATYFSIYTGLYPERYESGVVIRYKYVPFFERYIHIIHPCQNNFCDYRTIDDLKWEDNNVLVLTSTREEQKNTIYLEVKNLYIERIPFLFFLLTLILGIEILDYQKSKSLIFPPTT